MKLNPLATASAALLGSVGISTAGLVTNVVNRSEIKQIDDNYTDEINKLSNAKAITLTEMDTLDQTSEDIVSAINDFKQDFDTYDFTNWYYSLAKYFEDNHSKDTSVGTVYNSFHRPRLLSLTIRDFTDKESNYIDPEYEKIIPIKQDWFTNYPSRDDTALGYKELYNQQEMKDVWTDLAEKILKNTSEEAITFLKEKLILRFDFKFDYSDFVKMAHTRDPKVDSTLGDFDSVNLTFIDTKTRITDKQSPYYYGRLYNQVKENKNSHTTLNTSSGETQRPYNKYNDSFFDGVSFFYNDANINNENVVEASAFTNTRQIVTPTYDNTLWQSGFTTSKFQTNSQLIDSENGNYFDYCNIFCDYPTSYSTRPIGANSGFPYGYKTNTGAVFFNNNFKDTIEGYEKNLFFLEDQSPEDQNKIVYFPITLFSEFNNSNPFKHLTKYQNYNKSYLEHELMQQQFQLGFVFVPKLDKILIVYRKPRKDDHWNKFLNNSNDTKGDIPIGILDYKLSVHIDPALNWKDKY